MINMFGAETFFVLGAQDMSWWNAGDVLLGTHEVSCLEHKRCPAGNTQNGLEHRKCLAWNNELPCVEHRKCFA